MTIVRVNSAVYNESPKQGILFCLIFSPRSSVGNCEFKLRDLLITKRGRRCFVISDHLFSAFSSFLDFIELAIHRARHWPLSRSFFIGKGSFFRQPVRFLLRSMLLHTPTRENSCTGKQNGTGTGRYPGKEKNGSEERSKAPLSATISVTFIFFCNLS